IFHATLPSPTTDSNAAAARTDAPRGAGRTLRPDGQPPGAGHRRPCGLRFLPGRGGPRRRPGVCGDPRRHRWEAIQRLQDGRLTADAPLDYSALWSVAADPSARLPRAGAAAGGQPITAPHRARLFTDKANAHAELIRQGLGVPPTVLLRPWPPVTASLPAAAERRLGLGDPDTVLFLKPANGFGGRGVVRLERPEPEGLARAPAEAGRQHSGEPLLLQKAIRCPRLRCPDGVERPAYWRVLVCVGEILPFWWQPQEAIPAGQPSYRAVTPAEVRRLGLRPALDY